MRLVYIDEAGTGGKHDEPYVVVAGLIVHGDEQLNKLIKKLKKVRGKYIPDELQDEVPSVVRLPRGGRHATSFCC